MSSLTLLHNPNCSTSVHALDALTLDLDGADLDTVVATLVAHPKLLQRPILDDGEHAVIGRPRDRAAAWARDGRAVTE